MSYDLTAKELNRVIALPRAERLRHFLDRAVETGVLWTLAQDEALVVLGVDEDPEFVAVWPHPDYVLRWFEESGLEEADLVSMDIADWIESTFDELAEAGIGIHIFPTDEDEGEIVDANQLKELLRERLAAQ